RFDSLLYPEKLTLQRAAVVGRVFYDRALLMLDAADETHVDDLATVLQNLTEREFIFPRELSAFEDSAEYIFAQAMMRDLVLETLLERQAAAYHRAAAQWLAAQGGARVGEYDALIAQHYEQAGDKVPAAEHHYRAAKAAFAVSAVQEGIRASEKALALLVEADKPLDHVDLRLDIQLDLANVLGFLGDYDRAKPLLESALAAARGANNRTAEARALAQLGRLVGLWQNQLELGQAFLEEALLIYREVDDKSGLAFVVRQLGNIAFSTGEHKEARSYFEESLALGRALEDDELMANAFNGFGLVAFSTDDLEGALSAFQQGLEYAKRSGDKLQQVMLRLNIGLVYAEWGDFANVRQIAQEGLAVAQDANSVYLLPGAWIGLGWAALAASEFETARQYLEMTLLHFNKVGRDVRIHLTLALYAELQAQLGEVELPLQWLGFLQTVPDQSGVGRRLVERTLAKMRADLPPEQIDAALLRGTRLTLEDILREITENLGAQAVH
ncbi:MAG: tetratricopeptide repeat protein, partial [Candidatus Promineifilaceae bacterium]|nr:tetratricopeptide repeat protein [Candidatus Promineifilaceae bacterium]